MRLVEKVNLATPTPVSRIVINGADRIVTRSVLMIENCFFISQPRSTLNNQNSLSALIFSQNCFMKI